MNLNKFQKISISFFLIVFLFSAFSFVFSENNVLVAAEVNPCCLLDSGCESECSPPSVDSSSNSQSNQNKQSNINVSCKDEKGEYKYPWCQEAEKGIAPLVSQFYKIALGLAGASALGVLIYGSILWTLSGAVTSKQDAMEWISGALWGLALLLGAYLILNTINPQLTILGDPMAKAPEVSVSALQSEAEKKFIGTGKVYDKISGADRQSDEPDSARGKPIQGTPSPDIKKLAGYSTKMNSSNTSVIIDKSDKKMYIYYYGDNKNGELIASIPTNIGSGDLTGEKNGGIKNDKITPTGDFIVTNNKNFDTSGVYNKEGANMGIAFLGISAKDQNGDYRGIGIHGSQSGTIKSPTNGCIRTNNADLPAIFSALKTGTQIKIQN
ncbi:MAG: L,D-transpeptidase [Patescibacteria group bacterium]